LCVTSKQKYYQNESRVHLNKGKHGRTAWFRFSTQSSDPRSHIKVQRNDWWNYLNLNTVFVCSSSVTHSRAVELTASNKYFLEKLAVTLLVKKLPAFYYAKRRYVNFTTFTRAPNQLYSILMCNWFHTCVKVNLKYTSRSVTHSLPFSCATKIMTVFFIWPTLVTCSTE